MKKIYFYILLAFGALNILLTIFIISTNKKYVDPIDNKFISFEIPDGYYSNEKYDKDLNKFKFYNKNKSTIEIYLLDSPYSNDTLYTKEEIARSINYQILKNITGYNQVNYTYRNKMFYSKYESENNIIEITIKYSSQKVLVISYVTQKNFYNSTLINELSNKVIVK